MTAKKKFDLYQIITDQMIEALEADQVPWARPWVNAGIAPTSLISKKAYRGLNVFILNHTAQVNNYPTNYWLTWKQAGDLKAKVKEGQATNYTMIIFWKFFDQTDKETGELTGKKRPHLFYYKVYNAAQVDFPEGYILPDPLADLPDNFNPIVEADNLMAAMPNAPTINHAHEGRAYYSPTTDQITMPNTDTFHNPEGYYFTLFHEAGHATGHPTRLGRHERADYVPHFKGSANYSREELVAEMTAAFLAGITGIEHEIEQSAAYITSWLQALKDDKKLIVTAAGQAQKAADYIQGITWEKKPAAIPTK